MLDFGVIVRMQKKLPTECPLRLAPFINDPFAFIGEKNLDASVEKLKSMLAEYNKGDPLLPEAIERIDGSLALIRTAEGMLVKLKAEGGVIFKGYECTVRGSLYQTAKDISNTLWFEAFRQVGALELTFQVHATLELNAVWAQVFMISKKGDGEAESALKRLGSPGVWNYSMLKGPGTYAYVLEKQIAGSEPVTETMKSALSLMEELQKELAGKAGPAPSPSRAAS